MLLPSPDTSSVRSPEGEVLWITAHDAKRIKYTLSRQFRASLPRSHAHRTHPSPTRRARPTTAVRANSFEHPRQFSRRRDDAAHERCDELIRGYCTLAAAGHEVDHLGTSAWASRPVAIPPVGAAPTAAENLRARKSLSSLLSTDFRPNPRTPKARLHATATSKRAALAVGHFLQQSESTGGALARD